jgi:hypothetical protein
MRIIVLMMSLVLVGCQSEIDKCVNTSMAAWDVQQARIKNEWDDWKKDKIVPNSSANGGKDFSQELGLVVKPDERSRIEIEAIERKRCMRFAAGK